VFNLVFVILCLSALLALVAIAAMREEGRDQRPQDGMPVAARHAPSPRRSDR
jgi:hypothetical protein